jgi:hypothetical protein
MKKGVIFLTGLLLLPALQASGLESFRVHAITPVTLDSQKPEAQTVELGYDDAIGIIFPQDTTFIKGVEVEIKIPKTFTDYPDSIAYGIYRQIKPVPQTKTIDYQAEQIVFQPLPARLSYVLQIPIQKNHNLKTGPYSTVLKYVHDPKGPLLFRLQPIMKGLPENIETLVFTVKIKPLLTDEGGFRLNLTYPAAEQKPVSVRIDEVLIDNPAVMHTLAPGSHHLSIVSDDYRNEVRVFTVESGKTTEIAVPMKDTTPRLYIVAPENTIITLDTAPLANLREGKTIEPGDHTLLFKIGDYEVTRQLTAEKGKDYTITMVIDVQVTETP